MTFHICNTDAMSAIIICEKINSADKNRDFLTNRIILKIFIAKQYLKRYNVIVSMSSQIRLQMVHRNVGGIVSSDMDDFVCGTCLP